MNTVKKYVFDLDNTLVFTDCANNYSYNYALMRKGLFPITDCTRITREILKIKYPNINEVCKQEIIELKRRCFGANLEMSTLNTAIYNILDSNKANDCILWTSAEECRVKSILEYYNLSRKFKTIYYSNKLNVSYDIENICQIHQCSPNQLVVFEDNFDVIKRLQQLMVNVICA